MLFRYNKHNIDKAQNDPDHKSSRFQIKVPADSGNFDPIRIHSLYQCFPLKKNSNGKNGVQSKDKESGFKDSTCKSVCLFF